MPMEMAAMGQMWSFILGLNLFFLSGWTSCHHLFNTKKRGYCYTSDKRQKTENNLPVAALPESCSHKISSKNMDSELPKVKHHTT